MKPNFKLIGKEIKRARTAKHLTQEKLAEKIERSVPYVSHVETARKEVSLKTLLKIANTLDVTIDVLLTGNQPGDPLAGHNELVRLMEGCNHQEKRFVFEIALAVKNFIQSNKCFQ